MIIICCDNDEGLRELPILGLENKTQRFIPEAENTLAGINYIYDI